MRVLLALLLMLSLPAAAQERALRPDRVAGADGVITQCVTFVRVDFVNDMCDPIIASIGGLSAEIGLPHRHLGTTEWGFGTDQYIPTPLDTGMADPLHLTLYFRGSENPDSTAIFLSLYRALPAGRLVVWEDWGLGVGDRQDLFDGLTNGLARKLVPVFLVIRDAG